MIQRVIDSQALVSSKTTIGLISIAAREYERRLLDADCLITLVQECRESVARDSWETEGSVSTADNTWTAVYLWRGDKKCSSSTYWNTGNPRPLVERWLLPVDAPKSLDAEGLYQQLESSFERARFSDIGQPNAVWFRAGWEEIRTHVEEAVENGTAFTPKLKQPKIRYDTSTDMVYLMSEVGTDWIKIGKCGTKTTSPPAKRRSMYQPGNRREIIPVAAWRINGKNPEAAMKSELKQYCKERSKGGRSEWFDIGVVQALELLSGVLAAHSRLADEELGR